jgi:membrane fusion protein (multidrug efflux system)
LILFTNGCKKKPAPPPPPEVQVITLAPTNVPIFEEWIGTLDGYVNAQIHAQVTGYLLTQNYAEGSELKKGDLLFQIDPRPLQAELDQANAKLAQDKAQAGKTELDVKRYTPLAQEQAISQEQLDNAVQANLAANAQVKADEAAVENGQLNLGFTKITSPIDGLAGIALAQIGDLVGQSGGSVLTTVSTINPIKVYFQVSEQSYLTFWRRLIGSGNAGETFPLQLIFADGSVYPEPGTFSFADRQVNPTTGTLQIVGLFSNADYMLRPGQYGRVRAQTQTLTNALLLPQRAVAELQGTYQVTVVSETNTVHLQSVTVGEQIGSNWIIDSGLKPGDRVVIEGTQKVKEGAVVNPKPFGTETNQASQIGMQTNSGTASQTK